MLRIAAQLGVGPLLKTLFGQSLIETVWKLGWKGVNEARDLSPAQRENSGLLTLSYVGLCSPAFGARWDFPDSLSSSTLAIWPYDTLHNVGILRSPLERKQW